MRRILRAAPLLMLLISLAACLSDGRLAAVTFPALAAGDRADYIVGSDEGNATEVILIIQKAGEAVVLDSAVSPIPVSLFDFWTTDPRDGSRRVDPERGGRVAVDSSGKVRSEIDYCVVINAPGSPAEACEATTRVAFHKQDAFPLAGIPFGAGRTILAQGDCGVACATTSADGSKEIRLIHLQPRISLATYTGLFNVTVKYEDGGNWPASSRIHDLGGAATNFGTSSISDLQALLAAHSQTDTYRAMPRPNQTKPAAIVLQDIPGSGRYPADLQAVFPEAHFPPRAAIDASLADSRVIEWMRRHPDWRLDLGIFDINESDTGAPVAVEQSESSANLRFAAPNRTGTIEVDVQRLSGGLLLQPRDEVTRVEEGDTKNAAKAASDVSFSAVDAGTWICSWAHPCNGSFSLEVYFHQDWFNSTNPVGQWHFSLTWNEASPDMGALQALPRRHVVLNLGTGTLHEVQMDREGAQPFGG